MKPVAFLTSQSILQGTGWDPSESAEHGLQFRVLRDACLERGIDLQALAWDNLSLDPVRFAGMIVGTTWDYAARIDEFLPRLQTLSDACPLFNPLHTIRWNIEKTYLRDLERRGVGIVPTLWRPRINAEQVRDVFEALDTDLVVIKPTVGQTAWRQVRLRRGESLPAAESLPPRAAMIQPFLPSIQSEGEYSFVFIDGAYSHCVLKSPAPGDYRIQGTYGGTECEHMPGESDLSCAQAVMGTLEEKPLHARVDMVRSSEGRLVLMECELTEPYLYPPQDPTQELQFGQAFAAALERRL